VGKAGRNESIKMMATHLNNIAVALVVGGVAVPLIEAVSRTDEEMLQWFASLLTIEGARSDFQYCYYNVCL
jgi:hypothetical protein